jgi:hypothetical protein
MRTVSPAIALSSALDASVSPDVQHSSFARTVLFDARYALDSEYLYISWHSDVARYDPTLPGPRPHSGSWDPGHLARVKRDGSSAPEMLGPGPDAHFIVADGYAYWGSPAGLERRALVPGAANEPVWSSPTLAAARPRPPDAIHAWPLGVSGSRLYFALPDPSKPGVPPTWSVDSVPATPPKKGHAGTPPVVHARSVPVEGTTFVDGLCVYSGSPHGVIRVDLRDGRVDRLMEGTKGPGSIIPETPKDPDWYDNRTRWLGMDARSLYWADLYGDRIVRWSR